MCVCVVSKPVIHHVQLCPVLTTRVIPRISSYSRSKKQQRFNNTKSRVILRITRPQLSRGQTRNKRGSIKLPLISTKLMTILEIVSIVHGLIHTTASLSVSRCRMYCANPLTNLKSSFMHDFEWQSSVLLIYWQTWNQSWHDCNSPTWSLTLTLQHTTRSHGGLLPIHQLVIAIHFYPYGSFLPIWIISWVHFMLWQYWWV